ncbi:YfhO family protein [Streptococcus sp. zg-JUN1979]|uniref:YfhO family protein n=1 Tax=Streptococcus sp. zg-JUN1979 TaxID=3391450 RepID=UPI0039A68768
MTFIRKHTILLTYLASFLLPLTILGLVFLSQNIYWKSPTTILASDGFHQYVIFAQTLRNILHGQDSLFYTFSSGLGLNFYALMSYYLGSFLAPFVYFFDLTSMPDAIYLFTLIKVGLMGLASFSMLRRLYTKLHPVLSLSLSLSYALMSFAISQIEINMWLDVFIIAPFIILGLHRLIFNQKVSLYYFSLAILLIQNYYFGFMMAIFLSLYSLVQMTSLPNWKSRLKAFFRFGFISILSALTSAIMLLPTYLDLSTHGETFTELTSWFTDNSWFLDLFAKTIVGSYDTTKFGAIPMIYVGLFPFFLTIIFFTLKQIKWTTRLAYALLIGFIIASFYLQPLDLFWQGMHAPNMFLHRYSWVLSLTMILLAGQSLSYLSQISLPRLIVGMAIPTVGFLLTFIFQKHYSFLTSYLFIFTLLFTLVYSILIIAQSQNWISKKAVIGFTLLFTLLEMGLNAHSQIVGIKEEWVFPSRQGYERHLTDIDNLVTFTKSQNTDFYRMERSIPQTGNDSMKFGYNGISQFSSIRNRSSSSILDRLGYQSTGTNLNLRYQNNSLIADSLFGIKYLLSSTPIPDTFGFKRVKTENTTSLYENQYASPLALLSNGVYKDVDFTVNTLDNQTKLLNQLTGLNLTYFYRLSSQLISGANLLGTTVTSTPNDTNTATISYQFQITTDSQVYVSMPNIIFSNTQNETVSATINGKTVTYTTDDAYTFFNLGQFVAGDNIEVIFSFPDNNRISFQEPHFYGLDLAAYQTAMTHLNNQDVSVTTQSNHVNISYQTDKESSLLVTLPYDKGWSAKINNKEVALKKAQGGFMRVDVPQGTGEVTLTFIPNGFKEGVILSLLGIIGFISYLTINSYLFKQNQT